MDLDGLSVRGRAPAAYDVELRFDVDSLHALRWTVAALAGDRGATALQVEVLVIIAGELATNAIRHGGGSGLLRLWRDDDVVFVQVSDQGPGIADPAVGMVMPSPERDRGRGLWIVRNLSSGVLIERGPAGRGAVVTVAVPRTAT